MGHLRSIKKLGLITLSFALAVSTLSVGYTQKAGAQSLADIEKHFINGNNLPFVSGNDTKNAYLLRDAYDKSTPNLKGKENKGADKNGPGTAKPTKNGIHGRSHYVDSEGNEQLIEYTHPDNKRRPAIIFVYGGGWRVDDGNYKENFREKAASHGFASFRLYYKLGPNRIYAAFNDIMNAVTHIRNNADIYNVDPGRLIMWGDSAGGSLTARVSASGKSGLAGAVCWSAPVNGIRDLFYSVPTALDGLDHSTCLNTQWSSLFNDVMEVYRGQEYLVQDPSRLLKLSPDEQIRLLESTGKALGIIGERLPKLADEFKTTVKEFGIDVDKVIETYSVARDSSNKLKSAADKLDPNKAKNQTNVPSNNSDLQEFKDSLTRVYNELDKINDSSDMAKNTQNQIKVILEGLPKAPGEKGDIPLEEAKGQVEQIAASLKEAANKNDPKDKNSLMYNIIQKTKNDPSKKTNAQISDDDALRGWIGTMNDKDSNLLNNFMGIISNIGSNSKLSSEQQEKISPYRSISSLISNKLQGLSSKVQSSLNGSNKDILLNKLSECVDNIIHMSPSIFASPQTPPMFMVNAEHEIIVPATDAYEMRDKVRSYGTRAEALILPGNNHMGYDERAVEPSFAFARSVTNPEPVGR